MPATLLFCLTAPLVLAADPSSGDGASGETNRSVIELLQQTGVQLQWDPMSRTGTFWMNGHAFAVTAGEPIAVIDFNHVVTIDPPEYRPDMLYLTDDAFATIAGFAEQHRRPEPLRVVDTIVIDPGHGGGDSGAVRELETADGMLVVREKEIVLDISLRVRDRLEQLLDGTVIAMTRETDTYPELGDRTDFAHDQREDPLDNVLFVSIHANTTVAPWSEARGVEIFYLQPEERRDVLEESVRQELDPEVAYILNDLKEDEYTWESKRMASFILDAIAEQLPQTPIDRGIREASYYVNRVARMPSILIETGFINNREEVRLLLSDDYRAQMAEAIAAGIAAYVADFQQVR